MKYLENPELRPKIKVETEATVTPASNIDADKYKKNIEDIKQKILELKTPYEQAMAKADEWRKNALNNLNTSSADYQKYKDQIGQVYDDMVKKANETALQSSKSLEDGFKRGFLNIQKDVNDFASLAESAVKNAFNSMEDTLTSFITTGKASFSDFCQRYYQRFDTNYYQTVNYTTVDEWSWRLFGLCDGTYRRYCRS